VPVAVDDLARDDLAVGPVHTSLLVGLAGLLKRSPSEPGSPERADAG